MSEESFILVNLKESKAKKIAQVISNETAKKILDFLSKKEATETEISKALNLPISTVHYNLKQLREVNLIQVDEFHYSEKGKEVDHYKVSNKFVVIAPETPKINTIRKKLSRILPVALIALAGAGFLQIINRNAVLSKISVVTQQLIEKTTFAAPQAAIKEAAATVTSGAEAGRIASIAIIAGADKAVQTGANETITLINETIKEVIVTPSPLQNIALWFLIGAVFAIVLYLIVERITSK